MTTGIVTNSQLLDCWALQQKNRPPSATPASTPATPPRSTVDAKGYRYPSNLMEFSGDRIMKKSGIITTSQFFDNLAVRLEALPVKRVYRYPSKPVELPLMKIGMLRWGCESIYST